MTYSNAIPQPTDLISISQGDILTNFSQLYTVLAQDHIELDDGTVANRGKHKQVTLPELGADPATAANERAFYAKAASGVTQLFMRAESNGTVDQLTYPYTNAQDGTFVFSGGIRFQWGKETVTAGAASVAVTFPVAFSGAPYSVVCTPDGIPISDASRGMGATNQAAAGFTIQNYNAGFAGNTPCSWFAIGPV